MSWLLPEHIGGAQVLILPLIGLIAGVVGGMFGIGGGLIMIPTLLFAFSSRYGPGSLHLFKLASLLTSIALSLPALRQQMRAGAVTWRLLPAVLGGGIAGVMLGGAITALFAGEQTRLLTRCFGGFMLAAVATQRLLRHGAGAVQLGKRAACPTQRRPILLAATIGAPAGIIAGLLGVAGGIWAVPAQHRIYHIHLRNAIANSTAMIVVLALAAALLGSAALEQVADLNPAEGWRIALWLSLGGVAGGWVGALLSQRLPVATLRVGFELVLVATGIRLLFI